LKKCLGLISKRAIAFDNLVNVVVFSLEEFKNKIGSRCEVFEIKTASTARFVSFAYFAEWSYVISTDELCVQALDATKK
jgi:hypothetical protein